MKKAYFPASIVMAPAYLLLGIVNLYLGQAKKNRGSTLIGMLWVGLSACWAVKAVWDIRDQNEYETGEYEPDDGIWDED